MTLSPTSGISPRGGEPRWPKTEESRRQRRDNATRYGARGKGCWQFRTGKCTSTVMVLLAAEGELRGDGVALRPGCSRACNGYHSGGKPYPDFDRGVVYRPKASSARILVCNALCQRKKLVERDSSSRRIRSCSQFRGAQFYASHSALS